MPKMQEPLKKLKDYGEDTPTRRQASLTQTHNVYFIEGELSAVKKPLKRFMGYMEVFPKVGEYVSFVGNRFRVNAVEYAYKFGGGRPQVFIFITPK